MHLLQKHLSRDQIWHHGYLWTPHEVRNILELFRSEYKAKKNLTNYLWPVFYQSYEIKLRL